MNITALLIVSSVSGVSALIWELKDRRDNGKRLLKFKTRFKHYSIEFLIGLLAGLMMYCLAIPTDETRMILLGAISGINANLILQNSLSFLDTEKADALRQLKTTKMDTLGEDERDEGENSGH